MSTLIIYEPAAYYDADLADIRKSIPHFDSGNHGFKHRLFTKPGASKITDAPESTFRSEITIAGYFHLVANPINNESGERLGIVVEWKDRTAEVAIEQEVAKVVSAAVSGD
jgi:methyl-accepting chemotaxis protein